MKPREKYGTYHKCINCDKMIYKTKSTTRTYCSKKCLHSCLLFREKLSSVDRSYMRTDEYSKAKSKPSTPKYRQYYRKVSSLTEHVYEANKHILNPQDKPRTLCGVEGGYQLDHKISVKFGFINGIPPETIARLENLQLLPWKENLQKGNKCQ